MIDGRADLHTWFTRTSNWNAVCLAGINGAALCVIDSKELRARHIASVETYIKYFLESFTDDGYCSECVGYWQYGFSHFACIAALIGKSTDGKVDLWTADETIPEIARFPWKFEIQHGVYPLFADVNQNVGVNEHFLTVLADQYDWSYLPPQLQADDLLEAQTLYAKLLILTHGQGDSTAAATESEQLEKRTWFPDGQVLISRPGDEADTQLAAAIKGGHNAEQHNHNDVGSFVVVQKDKALLLDVGKEIYTARTFTAHRYFSHVLNSYGHPVPVVGSELQSPGPEYAAKVLETEFTDDADRLLLDLSGAYDFDPLRKLTREFTYSRQGRGSVEVVDRVEYDRPSAFATALMTFSDYEIIDGKTIRVWEEDAAVNVTIDADGADFRITPVVIKEDLDCGVFPTRLGIDLLWPVTQAAIVVRIEPAAVPDER